MAQGVPSRLRPRIFLTFRHNKGGWSSAKRTGRLYPRRSPWYSLSETESTSGHMVLSGVPRKKSPVTPPGIDPGTVRLVVQRLNRYATPGPHLTCTSVNYYITIIFLYIKVKVCNEGAFLNRHPHKREGPEHFSLSLLRLKMRRLTPSRTMDATLLLDD